MKVTDQIALAIRDANSGIDGISTILLHGEAGVGKTFTAESMHKLFRANHDLIFFQLYDGVENEKILTDVNVRKLVEAMIKKETWDGNINEVLQDGFLYKLAKQSHTGRVVGVLDELDKADESTDTLLLDFIQNGRLTDPSIKADPNNPLIKDGVIYANTKNIILVITSNELRELNLPLYRRVRKVRMLYPTIDEQFKIIRLKIPSIVDELGKKRVEAIIKISEAYRDKKPVIKSNPASIYRSVYDISAFYKKGNNADNVRRTIDSFKAWFSSKQKDHTILENLKIDNKSLSDYIKTQILV